VRGLNLPMLDIRPRLAALLLVTVLFFLPLNLAFLGGLLGLLLLLSLIATGPAGTGRVLTQVLPLLVMVLLFTPFFSREGRVLVSAGSRVILTSGGVRETMTLLCRFSGITLLFSLFSGSTTSREFIAALTWFGLPYRGALVINLTLRAIPELLDLYKRVRDAHSLRVPTDTTGRKGNRILRKFLRVVPHLTSVLIITIKRIEPLSMSLELRGAEISRGRTVREPLPGGQRLVLHFLFLILVTIPAVWFLVKTPSLWYKSP